MVRASVKPRLPLEPVRSGLWLAGESITKSVLCRMVIAIVGMWLWEHQVWRNVAAGKRSGSCTKVLHFPIRRGVLQKRQRFRQIHQSSKENTRAWGRAFRIGVEWDTVSQSVRSKVADFPVAQITQAK